MPKTYAETWEDSKKGAFVNPFQSIVDKQKAYFSTNITKSYEWRTEQLDRLAKLLTENQKTLREAVCKDFKTASEESLFEVTATLGIIKATRKQLASWMKPVEALLPKFLRDSGYKGMVYREPYGVTLVMVPFNGPLTLLLDAAVNVVSAGNPCVLKVSDQIPNSSNLILELVSKYFDPSAVTAVPGSREENTELLELPFDFIFFTGSVNVGKVVMRAAAENLTPILLELGGQNPVFVDQTANLKDAAKKIAWGALAWGGQWCTRPGYACVQESIAEEKGSTPVHTNRFVGSASSHIGNLQARRGGTGRGTDGTGKTIGSVPLTYATSRI
jgi:acyl-CoA reductase-like NAD-dependent aldehyde dehydrogenase